MKHLALPQARGDVSYLVLTQKAEATETPSHLLREDVRIVSLPSLGLSASRAAAIELAQGTFLLISDDDITLSLEGILAAVDWLERHETHSIVLGWRAEHFDSRPRAQREYALGLTNCGRVCAPELLVRLADVRKSGVTFSLDFGVGAKYPIGEDYVFLTDLLKAGLNGRSLPLVMGSHPELSTGARWQSPEILRARRAVLDRVFGRKALFVRAAYAFKHRHNLGGLRAAMDFVIGPKDQRWKRPD